MRFHITYILNTVATKYVWYKHKAVPNLRGQGVCDATDTTTEQAVDIMDQDQRALG